MTIQWTLSFSGGDLDREDQLRRDEQALAGLLSDPGTLVIPLWGDRILVTIDSPIRLQYITGSHAEDLIASATETLFLGSVEERAIFTADLSHLGEAAVEAHLDKGSLLGVRQAGALLQPAESAIAGYAASLLHWHRHNRYCGLCGSATRSLEGGRIRRCNNADCRHESYPRSDPAVIMLVEHRPTDGSIPRCLLGHHPRHPPGMYSTLAGFVEPGETLEQTVIREVGEETGIQVSQTHYLASQPWPFPSSLMVGFIAEAESTEIILDHNELQDARWFSREEVEIMSGVDGKQGDRSLHLPGSDSIARLLIESWLRRGELNRPTAGPS